MQQIALDVKCPSWNDMYAGRHWSLRKKIADEIHSLVKYAVYRKNKETFKKCRIEFVICYKGNRRHDPDNCNIKLFIDGLVVAGIIPDDNSKVIKEITIKCHTGGLKDKVLILIKEA